MSSRVGVAPAEESYNTFPLLVLFTAAKVLSLDGCGCIELQSAETLLAQFITAIICIMIFMIVFTGTVNQYIYFLFSN